MRLLPVLSVLSIAASIFFAAVLDYHRLAITVGLIGAGITLAILSLADVLEEKGEELEHSRPQ